MKGLDTNVLVRYLTQDEPDQARKANAVIEDAMRQGARCFINAVVLCELVWVLEGAYRYKKDHIVLVLEKILSTIEFSIDEKDLAYRAYEHYRDGAGDFSDHLIGCMNRKAGCDETFTFDRSLRTSALFRVL